MAQQTVIVTGASTGIGLAIARIFLERGHQVVMNSADPTRLEQAFEQLGKPSQAVTITGDVGNKTTG